jgi:DNA-binding transcriptional regulator YhcF (GntR family)
MRVPQSAQTRPFRETATLAFSPSRSGVGRALVLRKLSRAEPLGEQAAHSLRMALRRGALQPGQRLTTREVATTRGVSLTPAREALNRLTAERVLEQTPERVAMVPILTRARHQELCAIRLNLEGMAAKARVGINLGDIIIDGDDIYGDGGLRRRAPRPAPSAPEARASTLAGSAASALPSATTDISGHWRSFD